MSDKPDKDKALPVGGVCELIFNLDLTTVFKSMEGSHVSIELQRALDDLRDRSEDDNGPRGAVAPMWRSIADGSATVSETLLWAQSVAVQVVKKLIDQKPLSTERGRSALSALGLSGRIDENFEERRALHLYKSFEKIAVPELGVLEVRTARQKRLLYMRKAGFYNDLTDKQAGDRMDRREGEGE